LAVASLYQLIIATEPHHDVRPSFCLSPLPSTKAKKTGGAKKPLSGFMLFSKENRPKIKEENPDITFVSLPSCACQLLPLGGPAFSLAALATPMLTPSIFLMFQQTLGPNWKEAW